MKNVFLALVISISFSGVAQVFQVKSIEKINIPENPCAKVAAISEQGDFILLTSSSNRGLTKFDLATNHVNQLTDAMGAGYDVKISTDGQSVVYRTSTFTEKHLRKTALMAQDLVTGKTTAIDVAHIGPLTCHIVECFASIGRHRGPQVAQLLAIGIENGGFAIACNHELAIFDREHWQRCLRLGSA